MSSWVLPEAGAGLTLTKQEEKTSRRRARTCTKALGLGTGCGARPGGSRGDTITVPFLGRCSWLRCGSELRAWLGGRDSSRLVME